MCLGPQYDTWYALASHVLTSQRSRLLWLTDQERKRDELRKETQSYSNFALLKTLIFVQLICVFIASVWREVMKQAVFRNTDRDWFTKGNSISLFSSQLSSSLCFLSSSNLSSFWCLSFRPAAAAAAAARLYLISSVSSRLTLLSHPYSPTGHPTPSSSACRLK